MPTPLIVAGLAGLVLAFWDTLNPLLAVVLLAGFSVDFWLSYKQHLHQVAVLEGPRERALVEASHGAAMIVLPVAAYVGFGARMPPWLALVVMCWGGLRLFNGAKFSVGWRDPQLISRALIKIGVGVSVYVLVWHASIAWVPSWLLFDIAYFLYATAPYGKWAVVSVVWWCLVTGITKLLLVMRGFPAVPWPIEDPGMPHGNAGFWNPNDPGSKL